jgi:predicted AAA+ superfamily ATPase
MEIINRSYVHVVENHFRECDQMFFLAGPRQAGKTTVARLVQEKKSHSAYLNWDNLDHRKILAAGPEAIAETTGLFELKKGKVFIVFDAIHKFKKWKSLLKGFFDTYKDKTQILVTGSSKLDVYQRGGDSLMGRYFLYRLYPLTVAELTQNKLTQKEIQKPVQMSQDDFMTLLIMGGFPEPFQKRNKRFSNRWLTLRRQQLVYEDIRDLSRIQELGQMELLADILAHQSGQLLNYSSLATKVRVSVDTIRRWMKTLGMFYFSFSIQPWSKNVPRSLLKEPKVYLWDWSLISDEGARYENMVAVHLMKAVHFWHDRGLGKYDLYFLRDKEKREVDFLVTKNGHPWFMTEVKKAKGKRLSSNLIYFKDKINCKHAFQVAFEMDYIEADCFSEKTPVMVPARTFLSQLA